MYIEYNRRLLQLGKRLKITRQPAAGREVGRTSGSSDSGMIYFSEK